MLSCGSAVRLSSEFERVIASLCIAAFSDSMFDKLTQFHG